MTETKEKQLNNWINALLCLKYTKSAITDVVSDAVESFRDSVLATCPRNTTCNICSTTFVTLNRGPTTHSGTPSSSRKIKTTNSCPKSVCDKICDEIISEDRRTPQWRNTDATQWCTNSWTIAQCFMPPNSDKAITPKDTDFTAMMSIIANAKFMDTILIKTPSSIPEMVC